MRRAGLLLAAVALASCTRLDPERGRRYLCARDAGDPSRQCPPNGGAARHCGLEGVCLPDEPGAWRCATEGDCFGWHCGVAGVCYDLADAGGVDCRGDVDCAPAWHCGVAGVCYDLAHAGGVDCRADDDCAPGWHCGVERVCYERASAQAVACRGTVPADCADGWRCGRNDLCHDRDAGAPYACHDDTDCEVAWRCGLDGVCLDGALDSLRRLADAGWAQGHDLAPPLWGVPKLVAVSDHVSFLAPLADCTALPRLDIESATVVDDGGLTRVIRYPVKSGCADAGLVPTPDLEVERAPLPVKVEDAVDVADLGMESWLLGRDGGLWRFRHQDGQALKVDRLDAPFAPTRLRVGRVRYGSWLDGGAAPLLVFGGVNVARYESGGGGWTLGQPLPYPLLDVEELGSPLAVLMPVLALTEPTAGTGVYSADSLGGPWTESDLPRVFGNGCEPSSGYSRTVEVRQPDTYGTGELQILQADHGGRHRLTGVDHHRVDLRRRDDAGTRRRAEADAVPRVVHERHRVCRHAGGGRRSLHGRRRRPRGRRRRGA